MCGKKTWWSSAMPAIVLGLGASMLGSMTQSACGQVPSGYDLYPLYTDDGIEYIGTEPVSREFDLNPFGGGDTQRYVRLPAGSTVPEPGTLVSLAGFALAGGLWFWWRRSRGE